MPVQVPGTFYERIAARSLAVLVALCALAAPARAEELSKEACIESHSRGQDAREQGKVSLARKLFLGCAQSACPALVQSDCARFADELERSQPSLSFIARDGAGHDLPDTSVYVDGMLLVTRLDDGRPHDVDPGRHEVRFVHGRREQVLTVVVGSGEKGRTISATFGSPQSAAQQRAALARAGGVEPDAPRHVGALATIGTGLVLGVGGGVLALVGLLRVPEACSLSSRECVAAPGDAALDDAAKAVRMSNVGWGLAGVGAAVLVGGIIWQVQARHEDRRARVVAAPWVTPGSAGVGIATRL